jgi:pilus assembly protein TadC
LFNIIANIAGSNYGSVSKEFKKAVRQIIAGKPQIDALEELSSRNPSIYFRRTIWQIVNGMKAGSDMSTVIQEIIDSLGEEQLLQIQKYGSQLNPLAMFYMLVAVIVPALGVTFIVVVSSFLSMPSNTTKIIFWGLFGVILFFQIMFLGVIKSRRPSLLG